jgi:hypothetical protein
VERHEMQGLKPGMLTTGSKDPWLARAEAHFLSSRQPLRTGAAPHSLTSTCRMIGSGTGPSSASHKVP